MQYYLAIGTDNQAERLPGIYETESSAIMAANRETANLSPSDERFIRVIEDIPMGLVVYATKARQQAKRYSHEIDERNRISRENREKPWLPTYDGE